MSRLCSSCNRRPATHGHLCYGCRENERAATRVGDGQEALRGETYSAPGVLSGKPMLKIARYLSDEELTALLDSGEVSLTGKPMALVAREELDRRGKA